ncbi:hypothetical protein [Paenibacillus endoradicis]|uniref:hypothetical protein n=1 Tax=Paenibacillus endoradicis TaxID=2972487 RepID=UPI002158F30C|nr:hypothetical protein [Paenibacillus endoradicis]MCR8656544.1 hypothetical protein [Paenibacillus endoradicis]
MEKKPASGPCSTIVAGTGIVVARNHRTLSLANDAFLSSYAGTLHRINCETVQESKKESAPIVYTEGTAIISNSGPQRWFTLFGQFIADFYNA